MKIKVNRIHYKQTCTTRKVTGNSLNQREKLADGNPDPQEKVKSIKNGNYDTVLWGL